MNKARTLIVAGSVAALLAVGAVGSVSAAPGNGNGANPRYVENPDTKNGKYVLTPATACRGLAGSSAQYHSNSQADYRASTRGQSKWRHQSLDNC